MCAHVERADETGGKAGVAGALEHVQHGFIGVPTLPQSGSGRRCCASLLRDGLGTGPGVCEA